MITAAQAAFIANANSRELDIAIAQAIAHVCGEHADVKDMNAIYEEPADFEADLFKILHHAVTNDAGDIHEMQWGVESLATAAGVEVSDNGDFLSVIMLGVEFTWSYQDQEWAFAGDDGWQATSTVAAKFEVDHDIFWEMAYPILNRIAGFDAED